MKVVRLVIRLVSVVQEKGEYGESGHRDEAFRDTHHRERHASLSVVRYRETTKHTPPMAVRERRHTHSGLLDMLSAIVSPAPMPSSEERKSAMSVDTISISA